MPASLLPKLVQLLAGRCKGLSSQSAQETLQEDVTVRTAVLAADLLGRMKNYVIGEHADMRAVLEDRPC